MGLWFICQNCIVFYHILTFCSHCWATQWAVWLLAVAHLAVKNIIYIYIYCTAGNCFVWSSQPPPQAHRFCIEIDLFSVSGIILINRKLLNSTSNVCWRRASLRKFRFESEELKFIATPISIGMSEFTWKATCLVGFHWRYFPENSNLPPYGHFPPNFISKTSRGTRRCPGWPIAKPDGWCYFPM